MALDQAAAVRTKSAELSINGSRLSMSTVAFLEERPNWPRLDGGPWQPLGTPSVGTTIATGTAVPTRSVATA